MSNEIDTAVATELIHKADTPDTRESKDAVDIPDTTNLSNQIDEARQIVEHLYNLLHEDALHRLDLFQKYSYDHNANRWSPDLYKRCQLIEALRRKLSTITG